MNPDFKDLLSALNEHGVRYVVVGAFALAVHGVARSTGDIDIWVEPKMANAQRVMTALRQFGAPLATHGVTHATFTTTGTVYQLGLPPSRIDLLTEIDGVAFEEAWSSRVMADFDGVEVPVLAAGALRVNKRAAGRPKDLADIALLDELTED